jgi:hypothetical protein
MSGKSRQGFNVRESSGELLGTVILPDRQIIFASDLALSSPSRKNIPLNLSGKSVA